MDTVPISLQIVSFLVMSPDEQIAFFSEDLPEYRESNRSLLIPLINAMQSRLIYFFDHYQIENENDLRDRMLGAIVGVLRRTSRDDFLNGAEWGVLRQVARDMLSASGDSACEVPFPLPLKDWTYHFSWPGYS